MSTTTESCEAVETKAPAIRLPQVACLVASVAAIGVAVGALTGTQVDVTPIEMRGVLLTGLAVASMGLIMLIVELRLGRRLDHLGRRLEAGRLEEYVEGYVDGVHRRPPTDRGPALRSVR